MNVLFRYLKFLWSGDSHQISNYSQLDAYGDYISLKNDPSTTLVEKITPIVTLTRRILESLAVIDQQLLNAVLIATDCISLFSVILLKLFQQKRKDYLFTDLKKNILTMFVSFLNQSNHEIGKVFMQDGTYSILDDILMQEEDQEVVEIVLLLFGNICAEDDPCFRDQIL